MQQPMKAGGFVALLLMVGCQATDDPVQLPPGPYVEATDDWSPLVTAEPEPTESEWTELDSNVALDRVRQIGTSVEGRPIEMHRFGTGSYDILMLATIHGDEPAGTPMLGTLMEVLPTRPDLLDGRSVWVIPVMNPDGMANRNRRNANGIDLNRNFPSRNFDANRTGGPQPLSEPEAYALWQVIEEIMPARVISIHQPLSCVDFDGPGGQLGAAMAEHGDLPLRRLGARPGSLGSYTGVDLEIPTVTLELPGRATNLSAETLWDRYGEILLEAIRYEDADGGAADLQARSIR